MSFFLFRNALSGEEREWEREMREKKIWESIRLQREGEGRGVRIARGEGWEEGKEANGGGLVCARVEVEWSQKRRKKQVKM